MTQAEKDKLSADVIGDFTKAKREYAFCRVRIERFADSFKRLANALQDHPELVSEQPKSGEPDYRRDLDSLNAKEFEKAIRELGEAREQMERHERHFKMLSES